jgi:deoxyribodipyrimidine photo-lyase
MASTALRLQILDDRPPRPDAAYVLYWMIGARRASWNFALDRALHWAATLKRPLVVLEPLNANYPWASDRLHAFVIDGMRDNARAFGRIGVTYYPYLEPAPRAGAGLLRALARRAAVVVTDRTPTFLLPSLVEAAVRQIDARFEAVDSSGLLPLDAPPPALVFPSAYAFRRYLQRELPAHLDVRPAVEPAHAPAGPAAIDDVLQRWPQADLTRVDLRSFPIDHTVGVVADQRGGTDAARARLEAFVAGPLGRYGEGRNHPDDEVSSGLSPYLHFGHISTQEIVHRVLADSNWTTDNLAADARGAREGWWGAPGPVEAFLDQIVTWRELGFNMSARRRDHTTFEALPSWAIATLEKHAPDRRDHVYTLDEFADARTHDPLWNAAERQLVSEGRIHNYLRMLWGKKILEWTESPRTALDVMIALNDRYALDGRDPNSYSGIGWVLGRYDRPWAPERPIFGTVRYMSSANTARKLRVKAYLARYGETAHLFEP